MAKIPRFFREAIGTILDIWDILSIAFGIGGNMGVVAAAIANIPIIYPIVIGAVSIGVLTYGIVKTIIGYKKWVNIRDVPILDDLMQKALSLHLHLADIQESFI